METMTDLKAQVNLALRRTPEELELLFEDTLLLRDPRGLSALFEDGAVLVVEGEGSARGGKAMARLALATWESGHSYVAKPQRVIQARDIALIVGEQGLNVVRRGSDGTWHYAIICQEFVERRPQ
jgi:hypothetical protein